MEQLRHGLTNVSPKGQRCSVDQNTLKRTDFEDFVSCYFGCSDASVKREDHGSQSRGYNRSRHDRKETERFNPDKSGANRFERKESERFRSFTYEELIKRDKINLDILIPSLPYAQSASRPSRLIRRTPAAQLWLKDESLEDGVNLPPPK